jgi:hypothetical protein
MPNVTERLAGLAVEITDVKGQITREKEAGPRASVLAFAERMEQKLKANDHKSGWINEDPLWLMTRLREECDELEAAILRGGGYGGEAADVGNFAMFIFEATWERALDRVT